MKQYFQDPSNNDITELTNYIEGLNKRVSKNIDNNLSRVTGKREFNYKENIKNSFIPEESQDPELVLDDIAELFKGAVRWNHDKTMINITPPPSLLSVATNAYTSLFNPNFAQDQVTGGLATAELMVVKYLSDLVGWNWEKSLGIFTFGGKSTNMYGVKVGLTKCYKDAKKTGVKDKVFTITSIQGHPCHTEVSDWLGIGSENTIKVPVDASGMLDISETEKIISERLERKEKLACITVNCGTTIQMTVDSMKNVAEMRERLVEKYQLDYSPHIHADSVIGWVWLMFKSYDFERNPLDISYDTLKKIMTMTEAVAELKYVDSFGVDFHKSGFCPYASSVFIVKNSEDLYGLGKGDNIPMEDLEYGNYSPFQYSLELSRGGTGPISALTTLKLFGHEGFQSIISQLMNVADHTKVLLGTTDDYEVINNDTNGFVTIFMIKPEGWNMVFDDIATMEVAEAKKIADYNYKFYLFLLNKQNEGDCSFSFDYTSGYDNSKTGISIGVFKIYPTSPFTSIESIDEFFEEMNGLKKEFDLGYSSFQPKDVLYRPKAFVFR